MNPIDVYLEDVAEPALATLQILRDQLRELLPDAQEVIYYGIPTFMKDGVGVVGFAATKKHCSLYPYSGSIINQIPELADYSQTKGSLHFPLDKPLAQGLVKKIVKVRMKQIGARNA